MAQAIGDKLRTPVLGVGPLQATLIAGKWTFGSSSAVTAGDYNGDGITLTKNTTGVWDLVFPACAEVHIRAVVNFASSGGGDQEAEVCGADANAGTATIKNFDFSGGAAADPSSGDILKVICFCFA
jgi:hypothetical protein